MHPKNLVSMVAGLIIVEIIVSLIIQGILLSIIYHAQRVASTSRGFVSVAAS
jgi:Tfp pilus assembly protein PilE